MINPNTLGKMIIEKDENALLVSLSSVACTNPGNIKKDLHNK